MGMFGCAVASRTPVTRICVVYYATLYMLVAWIQTPHVMLFRFFRLLAILAYPAHNCRTQNSDNRKPE